MDKQGPEHIQGLRRDLRSLYHRVDSWIAARPLHGASAADGSVVEARLRRAFHDSSDLTIVKVAVKAGTVRVAYLEGLVDEGRLMREVIHPIEDATQDPYDLPSAQATRWEGDGAKIAGDMLQGSVTVIPPDIDEVQVLDLSKLPKRAIGEPETELTLRGPREALSEELTTQIAQIRRRLPALDLVVLTKSLGSRVPTRIAMVYRQSLVNPQVTNQVEARLLGLKVDAGLTSTQVGSYIRDHPWSIFPTVRYSERADFITQQLDFGKLVILVDGDLFAIAVPATLTDFMATSEDYLTSWYDGSFVRGIRLAGMAFGLFLPALYIALTEVNPDLVSPKLFDLVAGSHTGLPFTPLVEVVVMILVIEILREAALRLPKQLATTLGTVGAIVVGTAVVKAGFVSSQIIVLMTFTALSLFTAPTYELMATWRLVGWALLMAAAALGLYGVVLVAFVVSEQLVTLQSYGTPYLAPISPFRRNDWMDTLWRAPWHSFRNRPTLGRPRRVRLTLHDPGGTSDEGS